jgi:radical SAM protein (TIGR01212 family)
VEKEILMETTKQNPYFSIDTYLKNRFGSKAMKLSINGGFTCPNRDGTVGTGGCTFCSETGSGDFSGNAFDTIPNQMKDQIKTLSKKWPEGHYIAYFQNYTNTYADVAILRQKYEEALKFPGVVGLAIATRPDCLSEEVLSLLEEFNEKTFLWVELGLQTIHDRTAALVNRGYPLAVFDQAINNLLQKDIKTVVHLILGLPGESRDDMIASAGYIASKDLFGVKIQQLNLLRGTALGDAYLQGLQHAGSSELVMMEDYIGIVADILEMLPSDITIHRLTGDGPRSRLIGPLWGLNKMRVLNGIAKELHKRKSCQGAGSQFKNFHSSSGLPSL